MYIVPKHSPKIYLIHRDGRRWEFKNLEEAGTELSRWGFLGEYRQHPLIGEHFRAGSIWSEEIFEYVDVSYDYMVRDEFGEIITIDDLKNARTKRVYKYQARRINVIEYTNKHFRNGPIPGIGGFRGGPWCKNARTVQELREAVGLKYDEDVLEYDIKIRPNRNASNLPREWDGRHRSDWNTKNWKKHRKNQWKD